MTQKQAEAELKYRLAKYILQVLLDDGTIPAEDNYNPRNIRQLLRAEV